MAKTDFLQKSKEGFLKKLFGVAFIMLGCMLLWEIKIKVSAQDGVTQGSYEPYLYGTLYDLGSEGITPGSLGDNGFWRRTESILIDDDGNKYTVYNASYDTDGKFIKETYYYSDGTLKSLREYDSKGYLKKESYNYTDGRLWYIKEYEYDAKGYLIKETSYNPEGHVNFINEYEYDAKGYPIKHVFTNDGTVTTVSKENEYDSKGNLLRVTYYDDTNGMMDHIAEIEYDKYDNIVKCTCIYPNGTVYSILEYKYDEKRNEIEGIVTKGFSMLGPAGINTGNKRTSEYIYDDTGRCVLQKTKWYKPDGTIDDRYGSRESKWTWFGPVDERPISNNDKVTDKISALPDDGSIIVDYSDNAEVSADVFTTIAGTNKDVTFTSEGISWEFSGSDIDASAAKKIDLSTTITMISKQDQNTASAIENLFGQERNALVLKFADNGKLPGKAKIRINADEALKQYLGTTGLEVFYWDNENNTLVPIASKVSIDDNNQIVFEIDHCSYYVVKGRETTKEDKHIPEDVNKDVPEGYEMLFRLYNPNSGEHFYTKSKKEGNSLIDLGWNYEGEGWTAPISGTPVYRLYNKNAGDHHYTTSEREKNKLVATGWEYEGIGWYSETAENGKPLYRLYNPNATGAGSHHYTTSTRERDSLIKQGWNDEDIAWYGLKK